MAYRAKYLLLTKTLQKMEKRKRKLPFQPRTPHQNIILAIGMDEFFEGI